MTKNLRTPVIFIIIDESPIDTSSPRYVVKAVIVARLCLISNSFRMLDDTLWHVKHTQEKKNSLGIVRLYTEMCWLTRIESVEEVCTHKYYGVITCDRARLFRSYSLIHWKVAYLINVQIPHAHFWIWFFYSFCNLLSKTYFWRRYRFLDADLF